MPSVSQIKVVSSGHNLFDLLWILHVFHTITPGLTIIISSFEIDFSFDLTFVNMSLSIFST